MVSSAQTAFDTTHIPDGIWLNVFSKLPFQDYCQMRLTCKHFKHLSTAKRLKKWKLKLVDEDSVQKLNTFLNESGDANTLPISTVALHNLNNSQSLASILKAHSKDIRVLYLVDAMVFENVNDARLNNLEELYMYFERSAQHLHVDWDISGYKRLHTLDFALRQNFSNLYRSLLSQLVAAGGTIRLRNITLSYNDNADELLLAALMFHARFLKHFSMFCRTEGNLHFHTKLVELFRAMKNLESISLSGNCTNNWAKGIFYNLPQTAPLKSIGFEFTAFDTDDVLKQLVPKWTNTIENIKLISNRALSEKGMNELTKLLNNLDSLEIQYQSSLSLMNVANAVAVRKNEKLRKLFCNCLGRMCDESVNKLATNLPNLEELELSDLRVQLTNRSLGYVFEKMKNLRKLCIGCSMQNFPAISQLTRLEELNLNFCHDLTSEVAQDLIFPQLRKLNLNACRNITSEGFKQIAQNCPALEVLVLKDCSKLDDEALYFICRNLSKLRKLNIKHCDNVSNEAIYYAAYNSGIKHVDYKYDEFDGMYYWLE